MSRTVQIERAIYGKAEGQASDWRWLASTPGLRAGLADLLGSIDLGSVVRPDQTAVHWRVLADGRCMAIQARRSKAQDLQGRPARIERDLLIVENLDPAQAATLLVPRAWELNDSIWWRTRSSPAWRDERYVQALEVEVADCGPPSASWAPVLQALSSVQLAWILDCLQSRQPVLVDGLEGPLPAEALAALVALLAEDVEGPWSVRTWLHGDRPPLAASAGLDNWSVVLCRQPPRGFEAQAPTPSERAVRRMDQLFRSSVAAAAPSVPTQTETRQEPARPGQALASGFSRRGSSTRWLEDAGLPRLRGWIDGREGIGFLQELREAAGGAAGLVQGLQDVWQGMGPGDRRDMLGSILFALNPTSEQVRAVSAPDARGSVLLLCYVADHPPSKLIDALGWDRFQQERSALHTNPQDWPRRERLGLEAYVQRLSAVGPPATATRAQIRERVRARVEQVLNRVLDSQPDYPDENEIIRAVARELQIELTSH